jgi:myosin heavy subunit
VVIKKLEGSDQLLGTLEWDSNLDIKCKSALVYPRDDEECSLDLSKLKHHNDGAIIHSLGEFYGDMKFSAKIGKYFLCMNPGHRLVDEVGHHHNAASDMFPYSTGDSDAPLSIYSAADTAYRKVSEGLLNQTIVLRGCSGSGKTEASKHILQYLLYVENPHKVAKSANYPTYTPLGHAHNPFIDLASSPLSKAMAAGNAVLDIFGCAPSSRNPNSSRVIRQTKLAYNFGEYPSNPCCYCYRYCYCYMCSLLFVVRFTDVTHSLLAALLLLLLLLLLQMVDSVALTSTTICLI